MGLREAILETTWTKNSENSIVQKWKDFKLYVIVH